jgi:hypothetical protein
MRFPVECLKYNILKRFEEIDRSALLDGIASKKLSPQICYHVDSDLIRTPYADCITNEIHLEESFLAFMWAFMYATWVLHEEGSMKIAMKREGKINITIDEELLKKANKLLTWSLQLPKNISRWPTGLPDPSNYQSENEKWYGEKVNGIFQDAVVYLLFHEVAHFLLGHRDIICELKDKVKKQGTLTLEETTLLKGLEKEADQYAFEKVMLNSGLTGTLGILMVNCAALFLLKTPMGIVKDTHPDVDVRIQYVIESIKSGDSHYDFYTHLYAAEMMIRFFNVHGIKYSLDIVETVQDLLDRCLKVFDSLK